MITDYGGEYGKYIVHELKDHDYGTPEFAEIYRKCAKRVHMIDGKTVPGAIRMNTSWYYRVPERDPFVEEHVHDCDEILGFYGSDPENPYDLGGEIELAIGGEYHKITDSVMIFIPAGLRHMPLSVKRVDRPIFHFSIVMNSEYDGGALK